MRMKTLELNVVALVEKYCSGCTMVVIPPDAEKSLDLYMCKAMPGRHCLTVVTTPHCIERPLDKLDLTVSDKDGQKTEI